MNSVLRTEWLKLRSYKPFWVMVGLYAVCLMGILAMCLRLQNWASETPRLKELIAANPPFAYPTVWQSVGYIGSYLQFIPCLLVILNVTNEFTFRTHRQNLLEGWSRLQFLAAKLLVAVGLTAWCTLTVAVCAMAAGLYGRQLPSPEGLEYLLRFAGQTLIYSTFALFLGFLIRRAALAIMAFMMYSVILERIVAFFISLKFQGLGGYLPLQSANSLLPMPYLDKAAKQILNSAPPEVLILASVIWLALFLAATWFRFRHEDL